MHVLGVIPARFGSSRLPGKPLAEIDALPMIIHTMKRALMSDALDDLVVASDDERVLEVVRQHGGTAELTRASHLTGTDRVAEVAERHPNADLVVNIQGDEPFLRPQHINASVSPALSGDYEVSCPSARFEDPGDPTAVKVVRNLKGEVLYYSRAPLPSMVRQVHQEFYRQVCIYTFTRRFLLEKYAAWEQTPLERIEYVELLRVLEHGYPIASPLVTDYQFSIDTPTELARARQMMPQDAFRICY